MKALVGLLVLTRLNKRVYLNRHDFLIKSSLIIDFVK